MDKLPSIESLKALPLRAIVAYATRCARRVQLLYRVKAHHDHQRGSELPRRLNDAITAAEHFCMGRGPVSSATIDGIGVLTSYASGENSQLASQAAVLTTYAAFEANYVPELEPQRLEDAVRHVWEAVAAATQTVFGTDVHAAAVQDFAALLTSSSGSFPEVGEPIDPCETGLLGSLWPDGPPRSWRPLPDGVATASEKSVDDKTKAEERATRTVVKEHVFLSHCHDNQKDVAKLRDDLVAAGEPVWWNRDILGGQDWKTEIRKAMKAAYAVVVCFSREIEARAKSGIFPEVRDAIDAYREYTPGSVFLIPVRLCECSIPDIAISDTETLDSLQYIDLFPPSSRDDGLNLLVKSLQNATEHP